MNTKGTVWLKVTGILLLIIGAFQLISTIVLTYFGYKIVPFPFLLDLDMATTTTGLSSILSLGAGVLGVRYCARPARAKLCYMVGMFMLLVNLAINVFNMIQRAQMGEPFSFALLLVTFISLLLPFCYLIGARKNMPPTEED